MRLANENLRWGYYKIEGELTKLGFDVSLTSVRNVLGRHGIVPAPVRYGSIGWKTMMKHYKEQLLACDFLWWNRFSCAPVVPQKMMDK